MVWWLKIIFKISLRSVSKYIHFAVFLHIRGILEVTRFKLVCNEISIKQLLLDEQLNTYNYFTLITDSVFYGYDFVQYPLSYNFPRGERTKLPGLRSSVHHFSALLHSLSLPYPLVRPTMSTQLTATEQIVSCDKAQRNKREQPAKF